MSQEPVGQRTSQCICVQPCPNPEDPNLRLTVAPGLRLMWYEVAIHCHSCSGPQFGRLGIRVSRPPSGTIPAVLLGASSGATRVECLAACPDLLDLEFLQIDQIPTHSLKPDPFAWGRASYFNRRYGRITGTEVKELVPVLARSATPARLPPLVLLNCTIPCWPCVTANWVGNRNEL